MDRAPAHCCDTLLRWGGAGHPHSCCLKEAILIQEEGGGGGGVFVWKRDGAGAERGARRKTSARTH